MAYIYSGRFDTAEERNATGEKMDRVLDQMIKHDGYPLDAESAEIYMSWTEHYIDVAVYEKVMRVDISRDLLLGLPDDLLTKLIEAHVDAAVNDEDPKIPSDVMRFIYNDLWRHISRPIEAEHVVRYSKMEPAVRSALIGLKRCGLLDDLPEGLMFTRDQPDDIINRRCFLPETVAQVRGASMNATHMQLMELLYRNHFLQHIIACSIRLGEIPEEVMNEDMMNYMEQTIQEEA